MITCKFCGNENPEELQYCEICGKELQNTLLRSLVGFNADGTLNTNTNYNANLGGIAHKGFEDTGGGAASGPRRTEAVKSGEEKDGGNQVATIAATIIAILIILCVAAYFMIYANNAPFAHLKELLPF